MRASIAWGLPHLGAFLTMTASIALSSGCATSSPSADLLGGALPPLPAWQPPRDSAPVLGSYLQTYTQAKFPKAQVHAADDVYTRVNRVWLEHYVEWTWKVSKAAGVEYTPESYDCEDYSVAFYFFATRAAAKAGVHAAPLVARIVVQSSPTDRHALIGVVTDAGTVVVEPNPKAGPFSVWTLEEYNRPILSITFGDVNP